MLVLSGDVQTVQRAASAIWTTLDVEPRLWVGTGSDITPGCVGFTQAIKQLGSEHSLIVFDAWAGFHPDAFCAVAGTLVGGGLLLLLTPPLASWPQWADPDYGRMVPYGYTPEQVRGYFLQRVVSALPQCAGIVMCNVLREPRPQTSDEASPATTIAAAMPAHIIDAGPAGDTAIARQQQMLDTLIALADKPPIPCVITADRGRGKSALLGRALAHWVIRHSLKVIVTAAQPQAADQLMRWAGHEASALGVATFHAGFVAPDALLLHAPVADALFIDEAAMLPITVLQQLISRYSRVVLASTVHGYEGSGRGLAIKLFPWLTRTFGHWQHLQLKAPMRWRDNDPLESWLGETFCLNDDFPLITANDDAVVRLVSQQVLASQPALLHAVFGLLVSAHYRTTPSDLRDLLDGPNLDLWVLERGRQVLGVCLLAREGAFDDDALCAAILAGKRRPRGHLLPQTLAFHCHSPDALCWRCARIVRIAIAPALQGQGWGSHMLAVVGDALAASGVEVLGTSFALELPVLRFWQRSGMQVLRVGATRESASGLPSCLMARALSCATAGNEGLNPAMTAALTQELRRLNDQFRNEAGSVLPVLVPMLEEPVRLALCAGSLPAVPQEPEWLAARIERFAKGALPFESALGALQVYWQTRRDALTPHALNEAVTDVLAGRLSLAGLAQRAGVPGRAAAIDLLRQLFSQLLETPKE